MTARKPSLLGVCRAAVLRITRHRRVATGSIVCSKPNFLARRESTQYNSAYGLWRSFNHLDYSCWSCHRCDRETADAGKRSRRLHYHHSARHRRRIRRDVDRSRLCGRKLHRRVDHVRHRRHDPVVAVSIYFQTRRVGRDIALRCPDGAARRPYQVLH